LAQLDLLAIHLKKAKVKIIVKNMLVEAEHNSIDLGFIAREE
jgi:hypothetical protein